VVQSRDKTLKTSAMVVDWMRCAIREQAELAREVPLEWVVRMWEAEEDPVARGAPHVVIARAEAQERTAPSACTIALSHLELLASSFGLGACWAGFYNLALQHWPELRRELDLPQGQESFGALLIGYPAFGYQLVPPRREARVKWI
jgi:nitroreductase